MDIVLVRYKTRAEAVDENESLVHAVYDELRATAPAGFDYGTFKVAGDSTFFHLAMIDTPDNANPLRTTDAFKRFQHGIRERCVEQPDPMDVVAIDGYGAFRKLSAR